MAFISRDTVINEDDEFSTPEELIAWVESRFNVEGEVLQHEGPAGGWPVIGWSGSEGMLNLLDKEFYGGSFDD